MLHELPDGTRVLIRPVEPGDKPRLAAAVARLSVQSARLRFMAAKPSLSNAELRYLTEIDGSDHIALVAVLAGDPERVAGVARCVRVAPGADTAEFAIVVGDPLQGLGLGTLLTRALGEEAARAGIRRFSAITLAEHVAVERLIEHVAEPVERRPGPGGVRELLADQPGAA